MKSIPPKIQRQLHKLIHDVVFTTLDSNKVPLHTRQRIAQALADDACIDLERRMTYLVKIATLKAPKRERA